MSVRNSFVEKRLSEINGRSSPEIRDEDTSTLIMGLVRGQVETAPSSENKDAQVALREERATAQTFGAERE